MLMLGGFNNVHSLYIVQHLAFDGSLGAWGGVFCSLRPSQSQKVNVADVKGSVQSVPDTPNRLSALKVHIWTPYVESTKFLIFCHISQSPLALCVSVCVSVSVCAYSIYVCTWQKPDIWTPYEFHTQTKWSWVNRCAVHYDRDVLCDTRTGKWSPFPRVSNALLLYFGYFHFHRDVVWLKAVSFWG